MHSQITIDKQFFVKKKLSLKYILQIMIFRTLQKNFKYVHDMSRKGA